MDVKIGKKYKHFKGNIYEVLYIAYDCDNYSEDNKFVVYKNVSNDIVWIRKYDEFISLVDNKKYPNVKQKYRFEEVK